MPKALSTIQELIELTLFHNIVDEVVSQGYLPDVSAFPDTEAGYASFQAALSTVVDNKGFAVEVFNNSNPTFKETKKLSRIVLLSEMYMPGEVGGDQSRFYVHDPIRDIYEVLIRPPQTVDFTFNIHLIADTAYQNRLLTSMVANAIPLRGYIPVFKGDFTYQVSRITCLANTSRSLANRFFLINTANDAIEYYVWFNTDGDGGIDPIVDIFNGLTGKTGIQVVVNGDQTAIQVAALVRDELNDVIDTPFSAASVNSATVTVTYTDPHPATLGVGNSGFTITTPTPANPGTLNSEDFNIFIENISFAQLPVMNDSAMLEYIYRYQVKDVFFEEWVQKLDDVVPLEQIIVDIYEKDKKLRQLLDIS